MPTEKIKTVISAKDKGAKRTFKDLGMTLISLNQGFELLNKAMRAAIMPLASVVNEGREFGKQMSAVEAVTKGTTEQMKILTDEAKRLGATTAFTAAQAGAAMEELGRAGQSTTKIIETTGQALNLAAANGIELAESAKFMAIQMNIFKKEGLKANKAADLINQTIASSPQNFEDFTYAMQYAAQTGAAFNRSFEETTQIIGALAETGIRGSMAGTALNMAFARLAKPAAEGQKVLEKYGITLEDVNPATHEFADIVDVLNKANMKQSEIFALLGQRTAPKFFALIEQGGDVIRDFAAKQKGANTALEAAAVRLNNLDGDVTIYNSALSGLKLAIFDSMDIVLRKIVQSSTAMIGTFSTFVKQNQGTFDAIFNSIGKAMSFVRNMSLQLVKAFGYILIAIGNIMQTQAVITLFENLWSIGNSLWKIFGKLAGVILNIAEVVLPPLMDVLGQLYTVYLKALNPALKVFADVLKWLSELTFDKVRGSIEAFLKRLAEILNDPIGAFKKLKDNIDEIPKSTKVVSNQISATSGIMQQYVAVNEKAIKAAKGLSDESEKVSESVKAVNRGMGGMGSAANAYFRGVKKANEVSKELDNTLVGNSLVPSMGLLGKEFVKTGKDIVAWTEEAKRADAIAKKMDQSISKITGAGKGGGLDIGFGDFDPLEGIVGAVSAAGDMLAYKLNSVFSIENIGAVFGSVFSGLVNTISGLFTSNDKFKAALDKVSATIGNVVGPVIEAFVPVLEALEGSIKEMTPFFKKIAKELAPTIQKLIEFITKITQALQPVIEAIVGSIIQILQSIMDELGPVFIEIAEALGPLISAIMDILVPIIQELLPIIRMVLEVVAELIPLITALMELIKPFLPIIRFLIRIIAGLVYVIVSILKPVIQALTTVIKTFTGVITHVFNGLASAINGLGAFFTNLQNALQSLINALGGFISNLGGGGFFGFAQGTGSLSRDQLVRMPGMEPNAGLVKAHVGESVGDATGSDINLTFNIKAIEPRETSNELRRLLEELKASGRI